MLGSGSVFPQTKSKLGNQLVVKREILGVSIETLPVTFSSLIFVFTISLELHFKN